MLKPLNNSIFIERGKILYGDKYDYSLVEYKNIYSRVKIICPVHGVFEQASNGHLAGRGCPICSTISVHDKQRNTTESFIEKAKIIHGNKYDYSLVEYYSHSKKVKIICQKHGVFEQTPNCHLGGGGCPVCVGRKTKIIFFIEKAKIIHGNKYDYSLVEYKNPRTKIKIICPVHGVFEITPDSFLNKKVGCQKCKESKGEKIIRVYLEKIGLKEGVDFITEKTFNNCFNIGKLKFDFFFPNYNSVLEFQGIQHFMPLDYFGGRENYNLQIKRDKIKKKYCFKNKIEFYEIQYLQDTEEKIKEIMEIIMDKKINSKRKGTNGEKDLCKILNDRFGGNKFKRTVFSGAYLGKGNFKRAEGLTEEQQQVFLGDVFANGFNFLIEHKFYAAPITIFDFFNDGSLLNSWMEQVENDAANSGKSPLLIIKFNNKKRIVFIKEEISVPYNLSFKGWKTLFLDNLLKMEDSFFFKEY